MMTPTNEPNVPEGTVPNRFDRYVSAVWARTATPTGLITVVVLVLVIAAIAFFFRIDIAGFFAGWTK